MFGTKLLRMLVAQATDVMVFSWYTLRYSPTRSMRGAGHLGKPAPAPLVKHIPFLCCRVGKKETGEVQENPLSERKKEGCSN